MSKLPQAWVTAGVKETKVEARIDMSAEIAGMGKCPECKKPMVVAKAGNATVWACANDRISIPVPDGYKV
jgi:hypothetical protein